MKYGKDIQMEVIKDETQSSIGGAVLKRDQQTAQR